MKTISFTFIIFFLSIFIPLVLSSDSFILNDTLLQKLGAEGEIRHQFKDEQLPQLMPDISCKKAVLEKISALKPAVGVEVLVLSPKIELKEIPAPLTMWNSLTAISSLKGLQYFSPDKKKPDIFFKDA